jgi:uncharacterized protein (TIGR00725 family)
MTRAERLVFAVIGESDCGPELYAVAQDVGALAAKGGAAIVCGGLGGVMEAACRGATSAGGTAIGILPGTSKSDANPYVSLALPTGLGEARNVLVVRAADAVIAVGGMYGTLSEIALALKLGKPLVGLRTWELSKGGQRVAAFPTAATAEEAVAQAFRMAAQDRLT